MDLVTPVQTFVAVVRGGNFSVAARQLGVAPSVVARRVAQLEREMHTRLFERTTRRMVLTEAGERLQARAIGLVDEFEALLNSVARDESQLVGALKVMAPTTLTTAWLGPVFTGFLQQHPAITLTLALQDRSTNPLEGGFDLAISGRAASWPGVLDIPLGPVQPQLCATPAWLAARAPLTHPRELAAHEALVFSGTGSAWTFQGPRGSVTVDMSPRLCADDNHTLLHAALAGLGVALLPAYIAAPALADGRLQRLLPGYTPQENGFKAYIPRRRAGVARVKALVAHLQAAWAQAPGLAPR